MTDEQSPPPCKNYYDICAQFNAMQERVFKRLDRVEDKLEAWNENRMGECRKLGSAIKVKEILLDPHDDDNIGKSLLLSSTTEESKDNVRRDFTSKYCGATVRRLPKGDVLVISKARKTDTPSLMTNGNYASSHIACFKCGLSMSPHAYDEHLSIVHGDRLSLEDLALSDASAALALLSFNKGAGAGDDYFLAGHSGGIGFASLGPMSGTKGKADIVKRQLDFGPVRSNSSSEDEGPLRSLVKAGQQKTTSATFGECYSTLSDVSPPKATKRRKNKGHFPCTLCEKAYVLRGNLTRHMRSKHPTDDSSGISPYAKRQSGRITKQDVKGGSTHVVDAIKAKGGSVARAIAQAEEATKQKRIARSHGSNHMKSQADVKQCYLCGRFVPLWFIDSHMRGVHDAFTGPDPPPGWNRPMPPDPEAKGSVD